MGLTIDDDRQWSEGRSVEDEEVKLKFLDACLGKLLFDACRKRCNDHRCYYSVQCVGNWNAASRLWHGSEKQMGGQPHAYLVSALQHSTASNSTTENCSAGFVGRRCMSGVRN